MRFGFLLLIIGFLTSCGDRNFEGGSKGESDQSSSNFELGFIDDYTLLLNGFSIDLYSINKIENYAVTVEIKFNTKINKVFFQNTFIGDLECVTDASSTNCSVKWSEDFKRLPDVYMSAMINLPLYQLDFNFSEKIGYQAIDAEPLFLCDTSYGSEIIGEKMFLSLSRKNPKQSVTLTHFKFGDEYTENPPSLNKDDSNTTFVSTDFDSFFTENYFISSYLVHGEVPFLEIVASSKNKTVHICVSDD